MDLRVRGPDDVVALFTPIPRGCSQLVAVAPCGCADWLLVQPGRPSVELIVGMGRLRPDGVVLITGERSVSATRARRAEFEELRQSCRADSVVLLDWILVDGHRWRSLAEAALPDR